MVYYVPSLRAVSAFTHLVLRTTQCGRYYFPPYFMTGYVEVATVKHIRGALYTVWSMSLAPLVVMRGKTFMPYTQGPTLWVTGALSNLPKVPQLEAKL